MPYFSDRKIAIKSVPPLVALANRHRLIANALINPPKIEISRISSVMGNDGTISVRIPLTTIIRQE